MLLKVTNCNSSSFYIIKMHLYIHLSDNEHYTNNNTYFPKRFNIFFFEIANEATDIFRNKVEITSLYSNKAAACSLIFP